jgi:hypothetical protein
MNTLITRTNINKTQNISNYYYNYFYGEYIFLENNKLQNTTNKVNTVLNIGMDSSIDEINIGKNNINVSKISATNITTNNISIDGTLYATNTYTNRSLINSYIDYELQGIPIRRYTYNTSTTNISYGNAAIYNQGINVMNTSVIRTNIKK